MGYVNGNSNIALAGAIFLVHQPNENLIILFLSNAIGTIEKKNIIKDINAIDGCKPNTQNTEK